MGEVVVIDPGHGGSDNGAVWGYAEEDDINLSIAYLLRCELQLKNYEVCLTRERDCFVSLSHRVSFANKLGCRLFISVHCDSFHNTTVKGISTHVYPNCSERSRIFANSVQRTLTDSFPDHTNRGVKESDFYVLRKTFMPAILVECEFLSNPETRKFLHEPENQLALARAISVGFTERLE